MKLGTSTLILGVALAVVAGLFSAAAFGLIGTKTDAQTSTAATGLFTGHVTTIHKDAAGNIIGYRQTDNLIVNQGENCALKLLFASNSGLATGNSVCTGANTIGFRYIAIGNVSNAQTGTPPSPTSTDVKLFNPYNSTAANAGMARQFGVVGTTTANGWTNSTTAISADAAKVIMAATFTNNAGGARNVNESALFNNTDGNTNSDGMFARQVFSTISLNPNDSLTVQWTINIGGTQAIS
jgi:hypothetical protein